MFLTRIHPIKISYESCMKNVFVKCLQTSSAAYAGHSKWANIRHTKALKDGQKSAIFTKYARQIRIAIQDGGSSDPVLNSSLRSIIETALRKNMPMSTIQSVIKKSSQNKTLLKKYYVYLRFHQKVFMVCILYTDNFVQLKMELASLLKKYGTVYVEGQHLFQDMGVIETVVNDETKGKAKSADELEEICIEDAIECRVEEVEVIDYAKGIVKFMCSPHELTSVSCALRKKGYMIDSSEHVFIPKSTVKLPDDSLKSYKTLLDKLYDFPGVEDIYDNLEPEED